MLSIPHMIIVFVVVLVVFGPQKLPELARSFGKLMAEFRKASSDFKSAFEEEMRDLERQARIADLKKQVAEATAAADAAVRNVTNPATVGSSPATSALAEAEGQGRSGEAPIIRPAAETVPRLDGGTPQTEAQADTAEPKPAEAPAEPVSENPPSHDQQQPA